MANNSAAALNDLVKTIGSADYSNWTSNRYQFYDYVRYPAAGGNEIQFCVQPTGSLDTYAQSQKTLEQTNLPESRGFGNVGFLIKNIRTHIRILPKGRQPAGIGDNAEAISKFYSALYNKLADLVHQGTLVISIGQKEYFDIPQPFITCPPGFGPTVNRVPEYDAAAVAQKVYFQQSRLPKDAYVVQPPQLIEPGQTFSAKIAFDNANCPALTNLVNGVTPLVEVGLIFDGYILRPMQ